MIKKTNRNKAWNSVKGAPYRMNRIQKARTFLVVCEGQTEKHYLESFRMASLVVEAIDMKGATPQAIVDKAKELAGRKGYDQVWCVFDFDRNDEQPIKAPRFDNAIKSAESRNFRVAYSNDAFELWFCLHYEAVVQQGCRSEYYRRLSERWDIKYDPEGKKKFFCKTIHQKLEDDKDASQELAIKRARKLHERWKNSDAPTTYHKHVPCTTVYELVEELNREKAKKMR